MTALLDLSQLRAAASAPLDDFAHYEEIYFLGTHTALFKLRGAEVAAGLPRFAGVLAFADTEDKRQRVAHLLPLQRPFGLLTTAALMARGREALARVLVIDFNEDLAGKQVAAGLAAAGAVVRDCLYAMHQLGMAHTYLSVREEREHAVAHLEQLERLAATLGDERSKRTLLARAQALITLDRSALIAVAFPLGDFINTCAPSAGIVVRADETFIDAGAAHGDTVNHFYQASGGHYRAIHAFEPDRSNFAALDALCAFLPSASTYFAGLGERAGSLTFYEDPANRFGSNFVARPASTAATPTQMQIMAIDDITEHASLIKIDVEGFEAAVIRGAARVIAGSAPNMTVSAYHYPHDIAEIVDTVRAIHPYRHVALRHYSASLYDTQLLFSDSQDFA